MYGVMRLRILEISDAERISGRAEGCGLLKIKIKEPCHTHCESFGTVLLLLSESVCFYVRWAPVVFHVCIVFYALCSYFFGAFTAFTPSKVIFTGLMYPFSSKYMRSIHVTRLSRPFSVSGRR